LLLSSRRRPSAVALLRLLDAALSAGIIGEPTTDHAARYYKFESISLQQTVWSLAGTLPHTS
jgi:hypothetical protein